MNNAVITGWQLEEAFINQKKQEALQRQEEERRRERERLEEMKRREQDRILEVCSTAPFDSLHFCKLAVTVYQCLHGMAPPYLCDGLQRVTELNRRPLRSSMSNALVVPSTRLVTVGNRAFPVACSRLWNSLPTDVTSATTLPVFCVV